MLGFINICKPSGSTSHDVVQSIRRLTRVKQVGHAGTLDPMASGVLPIAVGSACRLLRFLPHNKTYQATILLGTQTDTDDIEGEPLSLPKLDIPDQSTVRSALSKLVGEYDQVPPAYSAIHYQGRRLYELARTGMLPPEIKPRRVQVESIEVLSCQLPAITVRIRCGAGTYIRSIARDLGTMLGCGGCLAGLVREQSGPFHIENSFTLAALSEASQSGRLSETLVAPQQVLVSNPELKCLSIDETLALRISHGQLLSADTLPQPLTIEDEDRFVLITATSGLLAICSLETGVLRPKVVISGANQIA